MDFGVYDAMLGTDLVNGTAIRQAWALFADPKGRIALYKKVEYAVKCGW